VHPGPVSMGGFGGTGPEDEAESESGGQEGLCVCTLMSLYNLVDDSRLTPNPRQAVMEVPHGQQRESTVQYSKVNLSPLVYCTTVP